MTLKDVLLRINCLLNSKDRVRLVSYLAFSIVVSLTETVGITLILPFISLATNFDILYSNRYLAYWYRLLDCGSPAAFITILGFVLILFYFLKNVLALYFIYGVTQFSQSCYHRFAVNFFNKFTEADYLSVVGYHSAAISKMVLADANHLAVILSSSLQLLSEFFLFTLIYGALLWVNVKLTLVLTCFFGVMSLLMLRFFTEKVALAGNRVSRGLTELSCVFRETFANLKMIKLLGNEAFLQHSFDEAGSTVARAHVVNMTLQNIPRPLFEVLGLSTIIAVLVYVVHRTDTAIYVVPILSAYALAFYKFLTSLNRVMTLYNQLIFALNSLDMVDVSFLKDEKELGYSAVTFRESVILDRISFEYKTGRPIVQDISLSIKAGDKVALIGGSGVGKSTLIDIITGIYLPASGKILVDGNVLNKENMRSWRSHIGYVPQSIYLFDGTVASNVVFGRFYDEARIVQALKKAHIYNFLMQYDGLETKVGEGGAQLSGGQRQRIAIARALYDNPQLLILDEATSSLDYNTEKAIMAEVYQESVGKTLIIVAHRLSTIEYCDHIYELIPDGIEQKAFKVSAAGRKVLVHV